MNADHNILGVAAGASRRQLKDAYRRVAKATHPDRRPDDPAAAERFRQATEAYARLDAMATGIEGPTANSVTEDTEPPAAEDETSPGTHPSEDETTRGWPGRKEPRESWTVKPRRIDVLLRPGRATKRTVVVESAGDVPGGFDLRADGHSGVEVGERRALDGGGWAWTVTLTAPIHARRVETATLRVHAGGRTVPIEVRAAVAARAAPPRPSGTGNHR